VGTIRLCVFFGTIVAAWFLRSLGGGIVALTLLSGFIAFLFFLLKYNRLQKKKDYLETAIVCDQNELKALDYDFSPFDGANEKQNAAHSFSLDLDIFGNASLFQSINRTSIPSGKNRLIDWFQTPLQSPEAIRIRQEAVRELSGKNDFRHHFQVAGQIDPKKNSDDNEMNDFIRQADFIAAPRVWKIIAWMFPASWIISISLVILGIIPAQFLIWLYILGLIISESKAKKINQLQAVTGKKVAVLQAYSTLIEAVENEPFQSKKLKDLQSVFYHKHTKASALFKHLAQLSNELEQRANLMVHLLLNPLLLWDVKKALQLEDWKREYGANLLLWIQTLGECDAYNSLATFAFNHPDYTYPQLTEHYFEMQASELGHPLMHRETCVRNDLNILQAPTFLIITGANMAGKSTYLRTIGVNFVLACIGAPACARSLTVCPAQLITSLRTSDSLNDNESYFFAELKRLQMIIDRLHSGEKLFIILDEILKGTNSVDKQKGSLALIEQLIDLQTCGIIATHDLLLGDLAGKFPEHIKNFRFEADIQNDELAFSYRLREGVAQNMNACFLMRKMGIMPVFEGS
jgi:DNA mismatch repair ATPase MutS